MLPTDGAGGGPVGPHEAELLKILVGDPGLVQQASSEWTAMATGLDLVTEALRSARDDLGQAWQGPAASTAIAAFADLATSVEQRSLAMRQVASSLDDAAGTIQQARTDYQALPAVPGEPTAPTAPTGPSGATTYASQKQQYDSAVLQRNAAMAAREQAAASSVGHAESSFTTSNRSVQDATVRYAPDSGGTGGGTGGGGTGGGTGGAGGTGSGYTAPSAGGGSPTGPAPATGSHGGDTAVLGLPGRPPRAPVGATSVWGPDGGRPVVPSGPRPGVPGVPGVPGTVHPGQPPVPGAGPSPDGVIDGVVPAGTGGSGPHGGPAVGAVPSAHPGAGGAAGAAGAA
ncbi:MAG: hypothetical protein JWN17_2909, partial [Frankiales bacterium]|nr:hypothetical protein [Frankiales bacterium]